LSRKDEKLKKMSEDALIERMKVLLGESGRGVAVGIGDDAAVISQPRCELDTLITTDLLVEGTHFRLDWASPYQIGWKSLAASVSDIAAMGGRPTAAVISIGVRPRYGDYFVESLYEGIRACAERYGVTIAGGDTVLSEKAAVINVALTGTVARGRAVLRKGARPGDVLLVTSTCGDSAAGLHILGATDGNRKNMTPVMRDLAARHLKPEPSVEAGLAAAASGAVTAMMDLSDGLARDLPRLAKRSVVGAVVRATDIPVSPELAAFCERMNPIEYDEKKELFELPYYPFELAMSGGEDYNLLMAADPDKADGLISLIGSLGIPITRIGEIVPQSDGLTLITPDGEPHSWPETGFSHF
jgi:thiamine-monophosphate kinase